MRTLKLFYGIAIAAVPFFWLSGPISAGPSCAPLDQVITGLAKNYAESPVARGIAASGSLVLVFANDDGSTWTVVAVAPSGVTCAVASGEAWQTIETKSSDPGA